MRGAIAALVLVSLTIFSFVARSESMAMKERVAELLPRRPGLALNLTRLIAGDADQGYECKDLALGEARTNIGRNYRVIRTGERSYELVFNLQFVGLGADAKQMESDFRVRVRKCLAEARDLQDWTGQRLKLSLAEPGSKEAKGLTRNIVQLSTTWRSDRSNYNINAPCSTYIHEMLHLATLMDEYEEDQYACRVPAVSIMADHRAYSLTEAGYFNFVGPTSLYSNEPLARWRAEAKSYAFAHQGEAAMVEVEGVSCRGGESVRRELVRHKGEILFTEVDGKRGIERLYPDEPLYLSLADVDPTASLESKPLIRKVLGLAQMGEGALRLNWRCEVRLLTGARPIPAARLVGKDTFPLRSAHFRKIVYPHCREKNKAYDFCTSEAYLGPEFGGSCNSKTKAICQGDAWLE